RARWIPPCRLRAWTRCVRGPGDPPRTSRQAPPSGLRGPSGRTRSAVFGNPFASPVSRADNPGALKLLPLIITSLAEGLVTCRNSGVGAVPRVATSAADDLASDFECRCPAHVAAEVGLSINRRLRRRLGPFHVEGREDLPPLDRMSEIRSERDEGLEDCVANFFLPIVPGPGPQPVRRVLRVHRQRGFARRRQTGIRYRMEDAVQERFPRGL